MQVAHTVLATISEAGGGRVAGNPPQMPRRSLRAGLAGSGTRPSVAWDGLRRATVSVAGSALASVAAAATERHRPGGWRRSSSIKSFDSRGGGDAGAAGRQPLPLENTYRMWPGRSFQQEMAKALLAERLEVMLHAYQYSPQSAPSLSKNLVQDIKNKLRQRLSEGSQRYKLVILVTITEPWTPNGVSTCRALWSAEAGDACASAQFRNARVAASATVHAFYFE